MKDNNSNFKELENKVMSDIKSGKVKLRSKYVFLAKKLGLNSGIVLTIILSILFFSLALFYMRTTDNLGYLSFGKDGILAFLESFPYLLVISLILFLFVAGYLITKTEWSYKKPFKYFALSLIISVLFAGGVLAYTNLAEDIGEQAFTGRGPGSIFKPFLQRGIKMRGRGMTGKINEVGINYLFIETPHGMQYVDLSNLEIPTDQELQEGQFIIAIGKRENNIFIADKMQIADEGKSPPMIRRGINRCFGENSDDCYFKQDHLKRPKEEVKKCLDGCLGAGEFIRGCFDRCR